MVVRGVENILSKTSIQNLPSVLNWVEMWWQWRPSSCFILIEPFGEPVYPVNGGVANVEVGTSISVEMFQHRKKKHHDGDVIHDSFAPLNFNFYLTSQVAEVDDLVKSRLLCFRCCLFDTLTVHDFAFPNQWIFRMRESFLGFTSRFSLQRLCIDVENITFKFA